MFAALNLELSDDFMILDRESGNARKLLTGVAHQDDSLNEPIMAVSPIRFLVSRNDTPG